MAVKVYGKKHRPIPRAGRCWLCFSDQEMEGELPALTKRGALHPACLAKVKTFDLKRKTRP